MSDREVAVKLGLKCPRCGSDGVAIVRMKTTKNTQRDSYSWDPFLVEHGPTILGNEVAFVCKSCGASTSVKWEDRRFLRRANP